jgi:hypothetical protein
MSDQYPDRLPEDAERAAEAARQQERDREQAPERAAERPPTEDERAAEVERQRARAAEQGQAPASYPEAAAAAVTEVQTGPAGDAGDSLSRMTAERADPLPAEADMDRLMGQFKEMSERVAAMESELGRARSDYAAATAALGPPPVAVYAAAIHDKLVSLRNAHPDAPLGHFDDVIATAGKHAEAARSVIAGDGHVSDVTDGLDDSLDAVDHFVTRAHRRKWGKPIDFSAIESDLEYARDASKQASARAA